MQAAFSQARDVVCDPRVRFSDRLLKALVTLRANAHLLPGSFVLDWARLRAQGVDLTTVDGHQEDVCLCSDAGEEAEAAFAEGASDGGGSSGGGSSR